MKNDQEEDQSINSKKSDEVFDEANKKNAITMIKAIDRLLKYYFNVYIWSIC